MRTGALGPIESVYVRDPDGNLIELARYVDDAGSLISAFRDAATIAPRPNSRGRAVRHAR